MDEVTHCNPIERIRRNSQYIIKQKLLAISDALKEIQFLPHDLSSKLELDIRMKTPKRNEVYHQDIEVMIAYVRNWMAQQQGRLIFFSSGGAFVLEMQQILLDKRFLDTFIDESGIATEALTSGIKYGYCEGFYTQVWGGGSGDFSTD